MQTKRVIRIAIFAALILVVFYFAPKGPVEADSGYREVMGTFAHVLVVAPGKKTAQKCIDLAFEQLQRVDALMSAHNPESELGKINRLASNQPVKVSESTFNVLQRAVHFSRLTDGAFDVTVGALIDLWRESADANHLPSSQQIMMARSKVGYQNLLLDANNMTVHFAVDGMKLDLGGIAKGYAIDKAVEAMKSAGARGGMVDVGGDIRCFGIAVGRKKHWLIGLQDPNVADERIILTLKLSDSAVTTSGDYRRFVVIDGKKHSHIIDTSTGQSSKELSSVTVIASNATDADALATAVSVLGQKKGLELIESLTDTEAILIMPGPEYQMIMAEGAHRYIQKP
jgi:thiamine biosynthesis lipoprotein